MINSKKRILLVNESSACLGSGFSVLGMELMSRWYKTNKYDLTELATYSQTEDPRHMSVPWKVIGGIPTDPAELNNYNSNYHGQFGSSVFERVLLEEKPDIVVSWLDMFMQSYINDSPFRNNFKWIIMSMIDSKSHPIQDLDLYTKCDIFLPVTRFSKELISTENPSVKCGEIIRPGVDTNKFVPLDKNQIREKYRINKDANIVLMIARNQGRKLFPQLIRAFAKYLNKYEDRKTFLYLHTSFPDVGFDLCRHILEEKVGHRVLFTYKCEKCQFVSVDHFSGELAICNSCGNLSSHMPGTSNGVSRDQLNEIINIADIGVQYASSEGLCMPTLEMRSAGIPLMLMPDFAATAEQCEIDGYQKIKILHEYYEPIVQTGQKRCIPDDDDFIEKLHKSLQTTTEQRKLWSENARQDAIINWSFDQAAKKFERVFDSLEIKDRNETWLSTTKRMAPLSKEIPQNCSNSDFVDWCFDNILGKPEKKQSTWRHELIKGLNCGGLATKQGMQPISRQTVIGMIAELAHKQNKWENIRAKSLVPKDENTINWRLI